MEEVRGEREEGTGKNYHRHFQMGGSSLPSSCQNKTKPQLISQLVVFKYINNNIIHSSYSYSSRGRATEPYQMVNYNYKYKNKNGVDKKNERQRSWLTLLLWWGGEIEFEEEREGRKARQRHNPKVQREEGKPNGVWWRLSLFIFYQVGFTHSLFSLTHSQSITAPNKIYPSPQRIIPYTRNSSSN